MNIRILVISTLVVAASGCATPPKANPSLVESGCAQQCSSNLATCSSGFKMFPVIQQKQCNDTYDVCIKGCPARASGQAVSGRMSSTVTDRLRELDALFKSGVLSQSEYDAKRKEILGSL
jgi:hypothetical protein